MQDVDAGRSTGLPRFLRRTSERSMRSVVCVVRDAGKIQGNDAEGEMRWTKNSIILIHGTDVLSVVEKVQLEDVVVMKQEYL